MGYDPEKFYRIGIRTVKGVDLGLTPKFQITDGSKYASDDRDRLLHNAIKEGIIEEVRDLVFRMYEVKKGMIGEYLEEVDENE